MRRDHSRSSGSTRSPSTTSVSLDHNHNGEEEHTGAGDSDAEGAEEDRMPVFVAVRLKPNTSNAAVALSADPGRNTVTVSAAADEAVKTSPSRMTDEGRVGESGVFQFYGAFSESTSQETLYTNLLRQFVPFIRDGFDLNVLVYGQSGSGKTHSLVGPGQQHIATNEADFGLVVRLVRDLFHPPDVPADAENKLSLRVSFVDVDNEFLHDLLSSRSHNDSPSPVPDLSGEAPPRPPEKWSDVSVMECNNIEDFLNCYDTGLRHHFNFENDEFLSEVARGLHTVLTLHVEDRSGDGRARPRYSCVRFISLASSDYQTQEFASGRRVNVGLTSLKHRVGKGWRHWTSDDPLSNVLHEALGGRGLTVVLCCLSPLECHRRESLETLRFALDVGKITNRPCVRSRPSLADPDDPEDDATHMRSASVNRGCLPPTDAVLSPIALSAADLQMEQPLISPNSNHFLTPVQADINAWLFNSNLPAEYLAKALGYAQLEALSAAAIPDALLPPLQATLPNARLPPLAPVANASQIPPQVPFSFAPASALNAPGNDELGQPNHFVLPRSQDQVSVVMSKLASIIEESESSSPISNYKFSAYNQGFDANEDDSDSDYEDDEGEEDVHSESSDVSVLAFVEREEKDRFIRDTSAMVTLWEHGQVLSPVSKYQQESANFSNARETADVDVDGIVSRISNLELSLANASSELRLRREAIDEELRRLASLLKNEAEARAASASKSKDHFSAFRDIRESAVTALSMVEAFHRRLEDLPGVSSKDDFDFYMSKHIVLEELVSMIDSAMEIKNESRLGRAHALDGGTVRDLTLQWLAELMTPLELCELVKRLVLQLSQLRQQIEPVEQEQRDSKRKFEAETKRVYYLATRLKEDKEKASVKLRTRERELNHKLEKATHRAHDAEKERDTYRDNYHFVCELLRRWQSQGAVLPEQVSKKLGKKDRESEQVRPEETKKHRRKAKK